jgi:hypothetical protein
MGFTRTVVRGVNNGVEKQWLYYRKRTENPLEARMAAGKRPL